MRWVTTPTGVLEKLMLALIPTSAAGLVALCVFIGAHRATTKSLSKTVASLAEVVSSLSEQVVALQVTVNMLRSQDSRNS